jgi:hypothetical protein
MEKMSKKLQSIIWLIIAIIAIALIGFISYKAVIANTQKIENPTITFSIDGYGDVTIKLELLLIIVLQEKKMKKNMNYIMNQKF